MRKLGTTYYVLFKIIKLYELQVINLAAGGVANSAEVVLMMQLCVDGVFVGSRILKSKNPEKCARAIVKQQHTMMIIKESLSI